jgi:hypothetical protein
MISFADERGLDGSGHADELVDKVERFLEPSGTMWT